jgi:hypothetical protein
VNIFRPVAFQISRTSSRDYRFGLATTLEEVLAFILLAIVITHWSILEPKQHPISELTPAGDAFYASTN